MHNPPNIRLHVPSPVRKEARRPGVLRIGRFILFGGGPQYELSLIEISPARTSMMFPPGTTLATGELFEIVRPIRVRGESVRPSGGPRKVVALVKVVGVQGGNLALVRVLAGLLRRGFWAERLDENRIADRLYTL